MPELRSGVRRGRSAATTTSVREEEEVEINKGSGVIVYRRKRTTKKKTIKQPEPPEEVEQQQQHGDATTMMELDKEEEEEGRELQTRCFDEIREIGLNVVCDLEKENYTSTIVQELEEDEGNTTVTPYEEACEYLKQSAVAAQMARCSNGEMSAKKPYLEKGLRTQTLPYESSNSYEIDDETREGSVPLAAPECEVTNHFEMYNHKHEGSVPVDIPECETAKDDVVDSYNGKQKKKEKVAPTSKAAPVAKDEMHWTTRLSGKRKAPGTFAEQPKVEDHHIEAPEEFESDKMQKRRKLIENKRQEKIVEEQLLNTQNMVSWLEETLANFMQNGKSPALFTNKTPLVNSGNLVKELASVSTMLPSSNNKDLGVGLVKTSTMVPDNNNRNSGKRLPMTSNRVPTNNKENLGKGPALTFTRVPISNKQNLGKGPASTSNRAHLNDNENSGKGPTSTSNRVHLNNNENLGTGKGAASTSNRVHLNNNENSGKGPASTSNRVHLNNNENLGKGAATTSNGVHLNNNENSGKGAASTSNKVHLNNNENSGKGPASNSNRVHLNNNENLGIGAATTSNRVHLNENSGKVPAPTSNRVHLNRNENLGKGAASTSNRVHLNNNENSGKGPASTSSRVHLNNNENLGKGASSSSNRVHLNNNENSGKGPPPTSNRVHLNNNENLGKGAASTSNRVHLNNNENLGKRAASTSNRVHLNNNENLEKGLASTPNRVHLNNNENLTSVSSQSRAWRNDEENLPVVQVTPSRHVARSVKDSTVSPFQRFYNSVSQKLTGSIPFISVPVDAAVFGTDMELYLDLDDVRYMCRMEDLSENCVMAYIRHLYDILMKRGIQHKYEFINPASVSAAKDADLSKIITTRLMNTNCEWVFIPFNPEGAHWLLVVINMVAMSCYWLDPSGLPARYNIKPFVTFGLKGLQKDGVRRSSPIWYNIKCPKQKRSVECGLYVMKFMREIIDEPNIFTRSEPFPKSTYEQDEIDEVRLEWIQTVEAYMY